MNKELIYQAIQAIDHLCKNTTAHPDYDPQIVGKACAALEQALLIDVSPAQMAHADAVAEPEQPVAWADDVGAVIPHSHKLFAPDLCEKYTRPLYAAPTPRKPLTDEEIQTIWAKTFEIGSSANTFARAIERAHGITGEQHGS